jgi:PD-(D/E)XK nuclease superfamily
MDGRGAMSEQLLPSAPIDVDEAMRRFPTLRQSLLGSFDDCAMSAMFDIRYANGWSTHPQARGTIFHRFAAECLRTMKRQDEETIPVSEALEILHEVCRQRDVPPEEIVRVPLRELKDVRMAAIKFATDNTFTVRNIQAVEKRLHGEVSYDGPGGMKIVRTLTGQIDALIAGGPDKAIVLDWKDTWGIPPMPRENPGPEGDEAHLSYQGYFQQRFYGWLVLLNYPAIQSVTMREFYVRKTTVRKATLYRADMEQIGRELAVLAEQFDLAVMGGLPAEPYELGKVGRWNPSPGKHCGFCLRPGLCPIEKEARGDGQVTSKKDAMNAAAEMAVAERVREHRREAAKVWVDLHGPIPVRYSKGRRVLGWQRKGKTRVFTYYTPDESDRGGSPEESRRLEEAMRESTQRARDHAKEKRAARKKEALR